MTDPFSSSVPLRTAVAGIGGFGASHHSALRELEGEGRVKVVASCDPALERLDAMIARNGLKERGVELYTEFPPMLAEHGDRVDLMTVAAPIPLHAPMHRACVERGIPCYMEKPPTLDPEELESMIAWDVKAKVPTEVGFNFIYQPFRHELKERLIAGEFGALKRICFEGLWPRPLRYYGRNNWAGRLLTDSGVITLDSCCGNAMAHHVHNALFFGGTDGVFSWGSPKELEAELYRANPIEGTDTIFCRATLENGIELHIAASHACEGDQVSREVLECEKATIEVIPTLGKWTIRHHGGAEETFSTSPALLIDNLRLYTEVVQGKRPRPSTLLSDCRGFVRLNALFYLAAGQITVVGAPHTRKEVLGEGPIHVLAGIKKATARMIETGKLPSEQGVPWAAKGGHASLEDLLKLRECLERLVAEG